MYKATSDNRIPRTALTGLVALAAVLLAGAPRADGTVTWQNGVPSTLVPANGWVRSMTWTAGLRYQLSPA